MSDEILEYPIDGILDLHMFQPKEVKSVLAEYIEQCRSHGILELRIIHGKGKGVQRDIVCSFLEKSPYVAEFGTAADSSGWGATLVRLNPPMETDA